MPVSYKQDTELAIHCSVNKARVMILRTLVNIPVNILVSSEFFYLLVRFEHK